jgi:hypothetical protein
VPIVSLITDDKYLNGSGMGLFVGTNYTRDWEYPVHAQYFEDGELKINQLSSFRIVGGSSRKRAQKGMAVYARGSLGEDRFSYNPFENRDYADLKSFTLRAAGTETWGTRFKDAFLTSLAAGTNVMYQDVRVINVYINGKYYGCYTLTEHIGIHNNCVDEDDYSQLLELDSYYDETYKFKSMYYNLPVNVKSPDLAEPDCPQSLREIEFEWGNFEDMLRRKNDLSNVFSVDSFATFMLMNDLCGNTELNHPKSTFLYKPYGTTRYIFGPGWDFDWGFGYQMYGSYFRTYTYRTIRAFTGLGTTFFQALMEHEQVIEA